MGEKVTTMVLKVDLQCSKCYKKVKKVLCKFPEIQDQLYDEKQNKVTIKVVCCYPEKIRDKIFCKGSGLIKCIEILPEKKPDKPSEPPQPPATTTAPPPATGSGKETSRPPATGMGTEMALPPATLPIPVPCCPTVRKPVGTCCRECHGGQGGGPCYQLGYGPCYHLVYGQVRYYDGYYCRRVYDSCGGCSGCDSDSHCRRRCTD